MAAWPGLKTRSRFNPVSDKQNSVSDKVSYRDSRRAAFRVVSHASKGSRMDSMEIVSGLSRLVLGWVFLVVGGMQAF